MTKGRKPLWQKTILENVKDVNNFEELSSFLQKNPYLFRIIQQTTSIIEQKQKEKFNTFINFQNKVKNHECDKKLFKKIIEYREIYTSEKVSHILLKCMNDLSVTSEEYEFLKNYLMNLKL